MSRKTVTNLPFNFDRSNIEEATLLELYQRMLKPRMIEEKMLILLRQGKISKWFSGIGQEAISVGVTSVLTPDEFILPMHRNLGYLPRVIFHYIVFLRSGKERPVVLQKVVIAAFILELKTTISSV